MELKLIGHEDRYAVEQLMLSLFPEGTEGTAQSRLSRGETWLTVTTDITSGGKSVRCVRRMRAAQETVRLRRRLLQQCFYQAAVGLLPQEPAWGALAGVRPTKITTKHLLEGGTAASARKLLQETYYVSPLRSRLAVSCSESTVKAVARMRPQDISLYIGIPFCPSRCSYCSFVSRSIGKQSELLDSYLDALLKEIRFTGELMEKSGKVPRTLYIGGGTPTTLSAQQLKLLMDTVRASFDLSECLEYTVEGGRPDTLDPEKLEVIRAGGADRISVNPQTMEDSVLRAVGRHHGAADILRSLDEAAEAGFDAVNMDLIAGLPEDSYAGFCRSLDTVAARRPANITVHTLALKKGADLFEARNRLPSQQEVADMVAYTNDLLPKLGYRPYYLYRQKYMSGSFENVGWSRDGMDCLYNIYMMEELHSIVSLGGGGMSKLNLPGGRLERFHNPKFPEQYISMLDEVLRQKEALFDLMKGST